MFKRSNREQALRELEKELLAAEDEDMAEEEFQEDSFGDEDFPEEDQPEEEDYEAYFSSDYEEEYDQEPFYRNHANNYGQTIKNHSNRYGRGNPKRFDDDDFFDEDDFQAILELLGIAALILLWAKWLR